jgi:hypothetical protein
MICSYPCCQVSSVEFETWQIVNSDSFQISRVGKTQRVSTIAFPENEKSFTSLEVFKFEIKLKATGFTNANCHKIRLTGYNLPWAVLNLSRLNLKVTEGSVVRQTEL